MPSTKKRFSAPLEPSIEMPPSRSFSLLAPAAWVTTEAKSRPTGIFSTHSRLITVDESLDPGLTTGSADVTSIASSMASSDISRSTSRRAPRRIRTASTLAERKPTRVAPKV